MKDKLGPIALGALVASMNNENNPYSSRSSIDPLTEARINALRQHLLESRMHKSNGLKEFFYGEKSVWALNQKNADRKAKKNGWI